MTTQYPSSLRLLKKTTFFIKDEKAVLGLPMRITVSLVIGTVAMAAILSYILNMGFFPGHMIVTINPMINIITPGNDSAEFNLTVYVNDTSGHPIQGANIIIKGLGGIGSNRTNNHGIAVINITVELQPGVNEGYLDVTVKAPSYEKFSQNDMIKIVKGS